MGLIRAALSAATGVLADSWKDYFYCDSLDANTLVAKGKRRTSASSSNHGSDNIITNGSVIVVNEGQAMIIVDQGAVVDFCGDPGEYTYDTSTEPSFSFGSFGESIKQMFEAAGGRFYFGGDAAHDQRIYYFNIKEITGNKYGTANPVPFRVVDNNINLDIDISVRCNGEYSYKIVNPLLFYKNVCGNVEAPYTRDKIDSQLKSELLTALQPAFARISGMGIRYSAVPGHTTEMANALNEELSASWSEKRGIQIAAFGVNSITASEEDEKMIKELQRNATMRDVSMRDAMLAGAQADAMRAAASNESGAAIGFMGMNMAQSAGVSAQAQYAQAPGQAAPTQYPTAANGGFAQPAAAAPAADAWTCPSCGHENDGKFCTECGTAKPVPSEPEGWDCPSCGTHNDGKFCTECGTAKPAPAPEPAGWDCPQCGAHNDGKFCTEGGSPAPAAE